MLLTGCTALVCLGLFRTCILASFTQRSISMEPALQPGDAVLASPLTLGPRTLFGKLPQLVSPQRGDLVIVSVPSFFPPSAIQVLKDSLFRLLTFQKSDEWHGDGSGSGLTLKRVLALPGDSIRMRDGHYEIKVLGADQFVNELTLTHHPYSVLGEKIINGIPGDFPGSGSMQERILDVGEYFVAGDARENSSDSRLYGAVSAEHLVAKVLFRYWPVSKAGYP